MPKQGKKPASQPRTQKPAPKHKVKKPTKAQRKVQKKKLRATKPKGPLAKKFLEAQQQQANQDTDVEMTS